MRTKRLIVFVLLIMVSAFSYAAMPAYGADSVLAIIQSAMAPAINKLTSQAITWLAALASLQFVMTNYSVLKSGGEIDAVIAKTAGSFAWIAVCIYIISNGPQFIGAVGTQMFDLLGLTVPSPGSIIASTITVVAALAAIAVGVGGVGIIGSTTAGMLIVYILLFILAIGMFFAFKIFMIQLELGLVVMLSPLSFAFLGLNALKDQGIAPFKALISLAYRIILMTLILSAFTQVSSVATDAISGLSLDSVKDGVGNAVNTVLSALGAYIMLAYVFYKSDSIAASLAGGSTSMGTGDVAGAAAAGAAAGAAIASGGGAAAGALPKPVQSMANFMQGLRGGGSLSNASSTGVGGPSSSLPLSPPPLTSMGSGSSGGPGAEAASPAFETNKAGAPMNPDPNANVAGPASSVDGGTSGAATTPNSGSGSTAGVGGAGSATDQKFDKLIDQMAAQQGGGKKTFKDHLSGVNQHIAQEKAATHVSINTHHSD